MTAFADRTGIATATSPRRYLWTDAFALCNFLALHRQTDEPRWREYARVLIHQVHHILGRHRSDDGRTGWISGMTEAEGEQHPTAGGLRIGKPLPERPAAEPIDARLEWERDGQYYHYLTRWMHALQRCADEWNDAQLLEFGVALAKAAHGGFAYPTHGEKRLYWKMSVDLGRPLVSSMGQHDALDGLVVAAALHGSARAGSSLNHEIAELAQMCEAGEWTTSDPLGAGLLLTDALLLSRAVEAPGVTEKLFVRVLRDGAHSLEMVVARGEWEGAADERLPFRELGLSLGMAALERLDERRRTQGMPGGSHAAALLDGLLQHANLRERIESFWLHPAHQRVDNWTEHEDINAVMLASSMVPDGVLG